MKPPGGYQGTDVRSRVLLKNFDEIFRQALVSPALFPNLPAEPWEPTSSAKRSSHQIPTVGKYRDEEDDLSDLDIVVIKRTKKPFFNRLRETARLIPPGLEGVDVLVCTPEEFIEMNREGTLLQK